MADHRLTTDDPLHRDEDILAAIGSVLECAVEREMAIADSNTRRIHRDQRTGYSEFLFAAQQPVRIEDLEGEPQHGGNGSESDIALVPVETQTQYLLTLVFAPADHAVIGNRTRIGTGLRTGQCEAGYFTSIRKPRQVILLLCVAAVVQ